MNEVVSDVKVEMPWTFEEERFLEDKLKNCLAVSQKHIHKAVTKKRNFFALSVPMIIVPFVSAAVAAHIGEYEASVLSTASLTVTGVLNSISQLFNFGKQNTLHQEFASKYSELANYIENELMKPKEHRIQLDVFLERVNQKYNSLNEQAPSLI